VNKYKIELLNKFHNKAEFSCGEKSLDNYLHTQAAQDIKRSLSAVYVLLELEHPTVVGFYTLSQSAIPLLDLPESICKKLPRYPLIPVTLLGRLAIDKKFQKKRLGEVLLINALKRSKFLSEEIGSMAIVVEALNKNTVNFYEKFGFTKFIDENKLFITMETIKKLNLS
jgi:GNAT superfamily N-acetyltransferase